MYRRLIGLSYNAIARQDKIYRNVLNTLGRTKYISQYIEYTRRTKYISQYIRLEVQGPSGPQLLVHMRPFGPPLDFLDFSNPQKWIRSTILMIFLFYFQNPTSVAKISKKSKFPSKIVIITINLTSITTGVSKLNRSAAPDI